MDRDYQVTIRAEEEGFQGQGVELSTTFGSRLAGSLEFELRAPDKPGNYIVTADVRSGGMVFRDWAEAMVTVKQK